MHLYQTHHNYPDRWTEITTYNSLNWTERAYEYGEFELILYSRNSEPPLQLNDYLVRDDSPTVMIVETMHTLQQAKSAYQHKFTGRSLESMMEWRVTKHRQLVAPDENGMFRAQTMAENLAAANFGGAADANRKIPKFNFHRDPKVSDFAFVNDTGRQWQDNKWVTWDRTTVGTIMRDVLSACKPNGYRLFWQMEWDRAGNYHQYIRAPRKVETIKLSEENDNFTDLESVKSFVDQKSTIYEIFDTGDFDYSWPANNTTQTIEHTLRTEDSFNRREVLWDNTSIHKPYAVEDWNRLTNEQKKMVNALSAGFFPFWALDHMFPQYTPLELFSGKLSNTGGLHYRTHFRVGDVFEYVPYKYKYSESDHIKNEVKEVQLTEFTESWSPEGYSETPTISVSSRQKWNGSGYTLGFTRNDPGSVIVPRTKE